MNYGSTALGPLEASSRANLELDGAARLIGHGSTCAHQTPGQIRTTCHIG